MRTDSVDPDLHKLTELIETSIDVAQRRDHRFLEYLLAMARMELDNIAVNPPSETKTPEKRLETV